MAELSVAVRMTAAATEWLIDERQTWRLVDVMIRRANAEPDWEPGMSFVMYWQLEGGPWLVGVLFFAEEGCCEAAFCLRRELKFEPTA